LFGMACDCRCPDRVFDNRGDPGTGVQVFARPFADRLLLNWPEQPPQERKAHGQVIGRGGGILNGPQGPRVRRRYCPADPSRTMGSVGAGEPPAGSIVRPNASGLAAFADTGSSRRTAPLASGVSSPALVAVVPVIVHS